MGYGTIDMTVHSSKGACCGSKLCNRFLKGQYMIVLSSLKKLIPQLFQVNKFVGMHVTFS